MRKKSIKYQRTTSRKRGTGKISGKKDVNKLADSSVVTILRALAETQSTR